MGIITPLVPVAAISHKGREVISMQVLSVEDLYKQFGDLHAVNGVSFSVPEGICFGLLGPNGAGKTTTIEMMEGITRPTSGDIHYFGKSATRSSYQNIGIQFQNTALPEYLSVAETIKLFASFYAKTMEFDELVALCSLEGLLHRDARKLSGGQRQRLLLALALVNDPKIIFLDEPTTGLDPQARRNFWKLIQRVKGQGKTIILTTHYMDEAQVLCDEIVVMDNGSIIEQGSPSGLLRKHFDGVLVILPENSVPAGYKPDENARWHDGTLEIQTTEVDETVKWLIGENFRLEGLQVKSPNLEDLFIKLTGHELRV